MSINPEFDQIVATEPSSDGLETIAHDPLTESSAATQPNPALEMIAPAVLIVAAPVEADTSHAPKARARTRPTWVVPTAIGVLALIACATLGYLFYSTNSRLDATQHQLALTQTSLDATKLQVVSMQADASSKKVTADYLSQYIADSGKVWTSYDQIVACDTFSACRTAAQQALTDMQAFQSYRQSAVVPAALSSSDSQLGDSLSAGIAALQELISGMDTNNAAKFKDGFTKLEDAMLSLAKAEGILAAEVR